MSKDNDEKVMERPSAAIAYDPNDGMVLFMFAQDYYRIMEKDNAVIAALPLENAEEFSRALAVTVLKAKFDKQGPSSEISH